VHPDVSAALGGAGGSRHEPLEVSSLLARLQDIAAFTHLAATFMREVAAGYRAVVVAHPTCPDSQRNAAQEARG